jgi:hypothetical protein
MIQLKLPTILTGFEIPQYKLIELLLLAKLLLVKQKVYY